MKITKFEKFNNAASKYKAKFSIEATIPYRNETINKDIVITINDLSFFSDGQKYWFKFPEKQKKNEDGKWEHLYNFVQIDDKDFRDAILKLIKDHYASNL